METQTEQRMAQHHRRAWAALAPALFALLVLTACVPETEQVLGDSFTQADGTADQQQADEQTVGDDDQEGDRRSSVVQRRMQRPPNARREGLPPQSDTRFPEAVREIDGVGNNVDNQDWGTSGVTFRRLSAAAYNDGVSTVVSGRPNARAISQAVFDQDTNIPNQQRASDFVWQWGQFLDHDITETPVAEPTEAFDIVVPTGDPWFDPARTGTASISLDRSAYVVDSGVREQFNAITAFVDASNVYGAEHERADALRMMDGSGRLATSAGDLLPFNTAGLANAPANTPNFFLAGDIRANEQVGLTAMHTLFVREHNYWVAEMQARRPELNGEQLYETARAIVAAEMQVITYEEFLPALLGPDALRPYRGYRADVDASLSNEFATGAYRFGHSMLSSELLRLDADGTEIDGGHLSLAAAFFVPDETIAWGIEPVLRGLAGQVAQKVDAKVIDDVRNFLFGPPGSGGFDLVSLNIQRGRDHGIGTLNDVREALGLERHADFASITADTDLQTRLSTVYASVDDVDLWVGGLSEDHVAGALVGETNFVILRDQFERLRDGDRFWYTRYLPRDLVDLVRQQRLSDIIRRNTDIAGEIADDVFHVEVTPVQPGDELVELETGEVTLFRR